MSIKEDFDRAEPGPSSNKQIKDDSQFESAEDDYKHSFENYEKFQELSMEDDNFLSIHLSKHTNKDWEELHLSSMFVV